MALFHDASRLTPSAKGAWTTTRSCGSKNQEADSHWRVRVMFHTPISQRDKKARPSAQHSMIGVKHHFGAPHVLYRACFGPRRSPFERSQLTAKPDGSRSRPHCCLLSDDNLSLGKDVAICAIHVGLAKSNLPRLFEALSFFSERARTPYLSVAQGGTTSLPKSQERRR